MVLSPIALKVSNNPIFGMFSAHFVCWLYWRGTRPSKPTDGVIPKLLATRLVAELGERGSYLQQVAAFSRGLYVGSRQGVVQRLGEWRRRGEYRRRRHPIPLGVGGLHALREPRSHYVRV